VTIDAQWQSRVLYCGGVDGTASIEGLTVTHGSDYENGGGVYCSNSSLTFVNVHFNHNESNYGGGMCCRNGSSPVLEHCVFSGNGDGNGGGLACYGGSAPVLTDVSFQGNNAATGGGMLCYDSSPILTAVTFAGNRTWAPGGMGGAMRCSQASSPSLSQVTFTDNRADYGGALWCVSGSDVTLTNTTLAGNYTYGADGGAIYCDGSSLTLENAIIAGSSGGETIFCSGGSVSLTCCDVYGNAGGDWVGCIADQYGVNGNISEDPLFCGELNPGEPYTLHADSPCASENNPECGLIGAWEVGCGLTAVEPASWGSIKAMFQ
jgi:predicted outer membrane repeat protein